MQTSKFKYLIIRILPLFFGMLISIPIGLSMLDPNRRCGTGDIMSIIFWMLIFYIIWTLILIIESVYHHRKKQLKQRNLNLIMITVLPFLSCLLWIYFTIIEMF